MREHEFFRKKLDNGVTVLFEQRKLPVIATSSSVKFGARYENEAIKGISHFLEHLVFKGTKNRSVTEIPKEIEGKGGIINALTGEEITCYWNKLPSKHFQLGADVSRDLILNPLFEGKALERERKVILEEIKMYHDNPSTYVLEKTKEMLYKKPFSMPILGTAETVTGLLRGKIADLFNSFYSANNIIFCAVGNADWEQVLEEAKKFPKTNKQLLDIPIVLNNGEFREKRKGIDQAHLAFGFHIPRLIDRNRYAIEIFDSILAGGMSSRLFQEVREKRGLCYTIKSCLEQGRDYAYGVVYAGTVAEKVDEIKNIILKEIKKLSKLHKSDFNESKEKLMGLRQISKERCDLTMIELLQEELGGSAENYYNYEENLNSVKINDVRDLSKLKGYSFVSLTPE